MAKRMLVKCTEYNGLKDVEFVMGLDDLRLHPGSKYVSIATVDVVKGQFTLNGQTYKVFSDWSTRPMTKKEKAAQPA